MNSTKRTIAAAVCALFLLLPLTAQEKADTVYTFRFMPDRDMFYTPYGGNDAELERLLQCVEQRRADILSGETPLYVDGYCNAFDGEAENLAMAKTRSNRVKSELIVRQKLSEECFITENQSGGGDYVTVRIVIPAERDEAEEARLAAGRAKQEKEVAEQAERQRIAAEKAEAERIEREKEQARQAAEKARADSLAAAQSITGSPVTETAATKPAAFWYAGIQGGMPFGISAMSSFDADRTTPGWSAGIYGGVFEATKEQASPENVPLNSPQGRFCKILGSQVFTSCRAAVASDQPCHSLMIHHEFGRLDQFYIPDAILLQDIAQSVRARISN